ncbi:MAG: hypothetical protein FWE47_00120 [Oscillospiraceae bacterium]|nr:hypothetical protein [Oscillospiraceae bacterium]
MLANSYLILQAMWQVALNFGIVGFAIGYVIYKAFDITVLENRRTRAHYEKRRRERKEFDRQRERDFKAELRTKRALI